jgi:hypothetical protein
MPRLGFPFLDCILGILALTLRRDDAQKNPLLVHAGARTVLTKPSSARPSWSTITSDYKHDWGRTDHFFFACPLCLELKIYQGKHFAAHERHSAKFTVILLTTGIARDRYDLFRFNGLKRSFSPCVRVGSFCLSRRGICAVAAPFCSPHPAFIASHCAVSFFRPLFIWPEHSFDLVLPPNA